MRQQNNGRRRQNRGSNRRNFGNGNYNGNLNKNTVIDSAGPDGRQRGSVSQLNEKYTSLASDASSSDDRILAESFLQFADHYDRLQKEIEINKNEKNDQRPPRRKRGFQIRENELKVTENNSESKDLKVSSKEDTNSTKLLV